MLIKVIKILGFLAVLFFINSNAIEAGTFKKIHLKCISMRSITDEEYAILVSFGGKKAASKLKRKTLKTSYGKGCKECNFTGFLGRIGIFEVLEVDSDIRELINRKASSDEILHKAKEKGYTIMLEDGMDKVNAGKTTIAEVIKAVSNI